MSTQAEMLMNDQDDPGWFKDAIIYQLHIKAFFDSTNDGVLKAVGE
jgi:maltose alpha-D-glucosyltransferase/alpha-amylase